MCFIGLEPNPRCITAAKFQFIPGSSFFVETATTTASLMCTSLRHSWAGIHWTAWTDDVAGGMVWNYNGQPQLDLQFMYVVSDGNGFERPMSRTELQYWIKPHPRAKHVVIPKEREHGGGPESDAGEGRRNLGFRRGLVRVGAAPEGRKRSRSRSNPRMSSSGSAW